MEFDPIQFQDVAVRDIDTNDVVLSYLIHSCFRDTLESFISCTSNREPADYLGDIDRRKRIIEFSMNGNGLKAIELTEQLAPDLLQRNEDLRFELLGLHFVELVRSRLICEAVEFAKKQLRPFSEVTDAQKYMGKIEDHMALLAYDEPEKSPMFHLLSPDYRQDVADKLNRAILCIGFVWQPFFNLCLIFFNCPLILSSLQQQIRPVPLLPYKAPANSKTRGSDVYNFFY